MRSKNRKLYFGSSEKAFGVTDGNADLSDSNTEKLVTENTIKRNINKLATQNITGDYELAPGDDGTILKMNSGSAIELYIPSDSTSSLYEGFTVTVMKYGAGDVTFSGGVSIVSPDGGLSITTQYSGATLVKIGPDEWWLSGALG
jgi:hypothetical protein